MLRKTLFALLGLVVLSAGVGWATPIWSTPVLVDPNAQLSTAYHATPTSEAVEGATAHVRVLLNQPYAYINEALSTNYGSSWTSPLGYVYEDPYYYLYAPSLVWVGNVLHATWFGYYDPLSHRAVIFYARSTDFGATWSNPILWPNQFLANDPGGPNESPHLAVSSNGQQVVIVWGAGSNHQGNIVRVWSPNGGVSWNPVTSIGSDYAYLTNVTYTYYNGGRFVAVYSNQTTNQICSSFSTDGGNSWSTPIPVPPTTSGDYPALAANSGGFVMCAWRNNSTGQLFSDTSVNGGVHWNSTALPVATGYPADDGGAAAWPSLAWDRIIGNFRCAWASDCGTNAWDDIFTSDTYTGSWSTPINLTNHLAGSGSHGPRVSSYNSSGGASYSDYITFANETSPSLSIWETERRSNGSGGPIQGGGGQSKGVVQRFEVLTPLVRVNPNPASGMVRISCTLGEGEARGALKVYTITGKLVKTFSLSAPGKELSWNLKDEAGNPVANGIYLLLLEGTATSLSEKLVVMR